MIPRKLSNIELVVLATAWVRQPCSIYSVMKEIGAAESTYYKNRSGTTYSVVNRLVGFGLLEQVDVETESNENLIRVTDLGVLALQKWLTPPIPLPDIAHSADFLRARFFVLNVLLPEDRLKFIDNALVGLEEFLKRCEKLVYENESLGDYFGVLATVNIVLETRARIQWLNFVRGYVQTPLGDDLPWAETILRNLSDS